MDLSILSPLDFLIIGMTITRAAGGSLGYAADSKRPALRPRAA
jgi:hypothetical protein